MLRNSQGSGGELLGTAGERYPEKAGFTPEIVTLSGCCDAPSDALRIATLLQVASCSHHGGHEPLSCHTSRMAGELALQI